MTPQETRRVLARLCEIYGLDYRREGKGTVVVSTEGTGEGGCSDLALERDFRSYKAAVLHIVDRMDAPRVLGAGELAILKAPVEFDCAHCGKPFEARDSRAKYCSTRCRVAAHRKKG